MTLVEAAARLLMVRVRVRVKVRVRVRVGVRVSTHPALEEVADSELGG